MVILDICAFRKNVSILKLSLNIEYSIGNRVYFKVLISWQCLYNHRYQTSMKAKVWFSHINWGARELSKRNWVTFILKLSEQGIEFPNSPIVPTWSIINNISHLPWDLDQMSVWPFFLMVQCYQFVVVALIVSIILIFGLVIIIIITIIASTIIIIIATATTTTTTATLVIFHWLWTTRLSKEKGLHYNNKFRKLLLYGSSENCDYFLFQTDRYRFQMEELMTRLENLEDIDDEFKAREFHTMLQDFQFDRPKCVYAVPNYTKSLHEKDLMELVSCSNFEYVIDS